MWKAVKEVLSSKKAIMAITSGLAAGAARLGWNVDAETVGLFLSPFVAYIIGQGVADHGKGAAQVK